VTPLYPQKLALTSPTGGGRSVGMVRSRTKATEFSFSLVYWVILLYRGGRYSFDADRIILTTFLPHGLFRIKIVQEYKHTFYVLQTSLVKALSFSGYQTRN
jgi:hypothetical protein